MSWYYLDMEGNSTGPVTSMFILSKYHCRTGINSNTHIWNVQRGVKQWTEMQNIYSFLIDDTINSIVSGIVPKNILSLIMNPYHIYIFKKKAYPNAPLPIGKATVEIEYLGYLANTDINTDNATELQHFIQNRESIQLGMKKNAYGLEMALYKICEGEQCLIYIPWRLAYGEKGIPNLIPSKTDILFQLTVHKIKEQGQQWQHVKFEKWSKMKIKWNTQKQNTTVLYIKEEKEEEKEEEKQETVITTPMSKHQPPPANNINDNIIKEKTYVTWDEWLISMSIPQHVIEKLHTAGIASWDEIHAIYDDVDEVAKELGITAIQKIKLKAILKKLPPMNELPETKIESKPELPDMDDPKYLKTQITLLKEENLRLNKLLDENGSKQQVMESWDNLFNVNVQLQSLQKQLDEECKKNENKKIECMKLEKLLQLKDNQNYIDIQQKLYNNYCNAINTLINKIETSKSTLDNIAIDAINNIKVLMNKNGHALNNELQNKQRILKENKQNVKELKQIKLIENDESKNNKYDDMLLRIDNVDELTKKRQSMKIILNTKINILLSSINKEKTIILSKISQLCVNKYNQLFYKYFIEEMSIIFYDCKLISAQFVLNYNNLILMSDNVVNDSVLCKDGEKIIFDIPLTQKLLDIVRNKESEMNMFYDVLCLDKFVNNMIKFENNIIYNDPLTFSSIIGIHLTNSNVIQNIIKSTQKISLYNNGQNIKQNNQIDNKIASNLRVQAKIFVDNLTCLIVTGYAMLVINACNGQMDYIQCLTDLCLSHPTNSASLNKEKLNKVLKNIYTKELKQLVNDYFNDFGKIVFMEKIINNARLS